MNEAANRTVTINQTFDAPIALVWEAWTNPEHIAHWWGPKGMKIDIVTHDFEIGGHWKYSMPMPDGNEFISKGTYTEISPTTKIVTKADFKPMTEDVILEIILTENNAHTDLTFNIIHPTEEYKISQEKMGIYTGWGAAFDRLASHLGTSI